MPQGAASSVRYSGDVVVVVVVVVLRSSVTARWNLYTVPAA